METRSNRKDAGGAPMLLISEVVELKISEQLPLCPHCDGHNVTALLDNEKTSAVIGCHDCMQTWKVDVWPYGPPQTHEDCCSLHAEQGFGECDCKASDASDTERGGWT